jgi:uncharacterized membrane protein YcaP (DUF421 family)
MEWQALVDGIHVIIGSDSDTITWWQMSIRAIGVFFYLLLLIRFGSERIFGKNTSFDIVVSVVLGSSLSRALTGNASFFPTLAASAALVLLHMLLAKAAFKSKRLGHLLKGKEVQLIDSGKFLWDGLRRTSITEHDVLEGLRSSGGITDIEQVKAAYLERSGKISVIKKT